MVNNFVHSKMPILPGKGGHTNRANDMFYDPLFIVSGPKDHFRRAKAAIMTTAKYTVHPIFNTMFTDLPHIPKQQIAIRPNMNIPNYRPLDQMERESDIDVLGVHRHRFFQRPVPRASTAVPELPLTLEPAIEPPADEENKTVKVKEKTYDKKIQTMYRESSAQTSPWQPDYKVIDGSDPEILKLDFLKWGAGLPVGQREVTLIERARMKRQWERALPPAADAKSLTKRRNIIDAMEREEWAFREQEIEEVQNLRMNLLEKMLAELLQNTKTRSEMKMQMFCKMKLAERDEKLAKLKKLSTREKRRLEFNHRGIIMKYNPVNVLVEHADYKSELYAPMMRHGEHPKRRHMVIDDHLRKYRAHYEGVDKYTTLPTWLEKGPKLSDDFVKLPGTRLCIRETKWTNPVLKQLHMELKSLRQVTKKECSLRVRVPPKEEPLPTPEVDIVDDEDEENSQGLILVQSVLRGRAAQILVFEGRDNCRELIQELRSTHGVLSKQKIEVFKEKLEVKYDQREEVFCIANSNKIQEALSRLQGTLVGTLLDFLNKELRRLLDERKAHALGIMAERERQRREAAEAGRRQFELRRRLEHDEMFKQIVKVHQDTVDMYLEDIITEGMEFASKDEAKEYVIKLAKKFDEEITEKAPLLKDNVLEQEELIAELVHHFVLPEVEKAIVRQRIKKRQEVSLKAIHNELYNSIENLPKPPPRNKRKIKKTKPRTIIITDPSSEVLEELIDYDEIAEQRVPNKQIDNESSFEKMDEVSDEAVEDAEKGKADEGEEVPPLLLEDVTETTSQVESADSRLEVAESMGFVKCVAYNK